MRPVTEITSEMENFRVDGGFIRRDPVEPEPIGTIVLCAFRIVGYTRDCDGSLMARFEAIDKDGESTGWEQSNIGLYPSTNLVVTQEELTKLFESKS